MLRCSRGLALMLVFSLHVSAQIITTFAGADWLFQDNGKPAINAAIGNTTGIAVDAAGNVLVADRLNSQVYKIAPSGTLTVVAGNGLSCKSSPDGVAATSVALCAPWGVALDSAGNIYFAETFGSKVRKVNSAGIISTVAGNGVKGFGGDNGAATSASLSLPRGIAIDGQGNIFIADNGNARVRKVTTAGVISTVAGTGVTGFSGDGSAAASAQVDPYGVAFDATGNLYIADYGNFRVRRVTPAGVISTFVGGTSAGLGFVNSVSLDAAGNVYITIDSHKVHMVSPAGTITTIAGTGVQDFSGDGGAATKATLDTPEGAVTDAQGNVYISDGSNSRLRKITAADGTMHTIAGNGNYRYAGDGGPARSAVLSDPVGLARDSAGNIYVAEYTNNRVRKIAPDGTISTYAGDGFLRFSGDGGQATSASLSHPEGIAIDPQGNLYIADYFNAAIRKVTPGGVISTFAGRGTGVDGGLASKASLSSSLGVAADSAGNIYIAESNAHRVRMVNPAGVISTIAGTGTSGFSGDGGAATSAQLALPTGIAFDASGNIYIADSRNNRVRKISNGIITTVVGNGTQGNSGDGGPAQSAALSLPVRLTFDASGNMYIADAGDNRVRRVGLNGIITSVAGVGSGADGGLAATATLGGSAQDVLFDAAGNLYLTANQSIREIPATSPVFTATLSNATFTGTAGLPGTVTQQIALNSAAAGLAWSATSATQSGGAWLTITSTSGVIPASITVSVNASNLAAGTYQGSVTISVPQASPSTVTLPVSFTVGGATAANLQVQPASLAFNGASTLGLNIANSGGSALAWTAKAAVANGNWLSIATSAGTVAAGTTQTVDVNANATGLAAGVYTGAVTVTSATTNQTVIVPVTLTVKTQTQTILVSQSGLLFTGAAGGASLPPQTIGILNTGSGTMNWSVAASTLNGGSWLTVTPSSGSSTANSLQVPLVQVSVNPGGLSAGQYSGLVQITSSGADNSPQAVTVILNVLPAGSNPGVVVRPTGLIFTARAGGADPGSQSIQLGATGTASAQYLSGLLTFGGTWLSVTPASGNVSALSQVTMAAQPALGSLATGIYRGSLTLLFSDGSPSQLVDLLFVVANASSTSNAQSVAPEDTVAGCTPKQLLAVSRTLSSNFSSPTGWPASLEVQVADDCGNSVPNATVIASFSNGDPALALASLGTGIYSATWRPLSTGSQVVVTLRALLTGLTPALITLQGAVGTNVAAPAVFAGGVVNGASFAKGDALAPGSIVSIFGSSIALQSGGATTLPLPTKLNGASLTVGGIAAPLFYSSAGQVNAQIPFELAPNSRPQMVLGTSNAFAVPETLTIADVRPGIFTTDSSGGGQGVVTTPAGVVIDAKSPATAGDVVIVYCSGLGATNPAVASGLPAPSAEPLARAVVVPSATVGGKSAAVQFAGLVPGYVGLYQVNVQIPAGVTPNAATPLVLVQNGVASNTVTLATK